LFLAQTPRTGLYLQFERIFHVLEESFIRVRLQDREVALEFGLVLLTSFYYLQSLIIGLLQTVLHGFICPESVAHALAPEVPY
jgi:hypothetical protein